MLTLPAVAVLSLNATLQPAPDVRRDGAFGFPQKQATVLRDTPEVRVSAWSDREYLYVQAVLFTDGDQKLGETNDGREIGDWSSLMLDVDGDGKATGTVDRNYALNPWPSLPGLHYSVVHDERGTSGLTKDSKGRGAVSYVKGADGATVRVDSYLIPLMEIGRTPGDTLKLAYWGSSPHPELTVNSVGFTSEKKYYSFSLPRKDWHAVTVADRATIIDEQLVPEGRSTIAVDAAGKPMPEIGSAPPEIAAAGWLNWKGKEPPTLGSLRGKVVVVEFWATWCGPCVAGIPHLNEVNDKFAEKGLVILSLTDQSKGHIETFAKEKAMKYTVGTGTKAYQEYGVTGIPYAFVIGRDGKVAWKGFPSDAAFESAIEEQLLKK